MKISNMKKPIYDSSYFLFDILFLIVRVAINGSVSVSGNAATITLNNNFNGVFQCSLDGGSFANCMIYMCASCLLHQFFIQRSIGRYIYWIIGWLTYH